MDQLGSYRLRKRLAVGGMAEVYLGEKVGPKGFLKPVVIKTVLPQYARDANLVQLFLDEARLAALLNHPNIAQVYDFGLADHVYYIAMEYVPGYTLDEVWRKLKSLGVLIPLEHLVFIASQVCQGLHHAHALTDARGVGLGLVHRDVSPHNLIVSVDGSVKIVDFGVLKAREGLRTIKAEGAVGKLGYMSPEQARDEPVDGRSDEFSLAVCLWELMTGLRLHAEKLEHAPDYAALERVPSVGLHRSDVPGQILGILDKALSFDPDGRYPSCREMHLALERCLVAMTHYAGQAALAQYVDDLATGRIAKPEARATGELVTAVSEDAPAVPRSSPVGLDTTQRFEEVFGVQMGPTTGEFKPLPETETLDTPRSPTPRHELPKSAQADAGRGIEAGAAKADLRRDRVQAPSIRVSRSRPSDSRPGRRSWTARWRWGTALVLVCVLAYAGWGPLRQLLLSSMTTALYRVESSPPGAEVLIDGQSLGQTTPAEIALIADVDYQVTVRLKAHLAATRRIRATERPGVTRVVFELAPKGAAQVPSLSQP